MFLKDSQDPTMPSPISNLYAFGEFRADAQSRVLRRGEKPIALTPKAFDVLLLLIQHRGDVVSKDELMQTVWPDSFVEESNLTQTVFMLRKALGESSDQRYILTVQGRGYRFAPDVQSLPSSGNGHLVRTSPPPAVETEAAALPAVDAQSPRTRTRTRAAIVSGILAVSAVATVLWLLPALSRHASTSRPLRSIAVLPLDNFSADLSQDYFVDGMTDELITDLAKVSSLRVISRTSVMRFKGTKKDLTEIARELKVDGIVEGSVTRSGGRIRITAQLINAATDQHIWAETYDRDLGDVLKLQSEVAQAIAQQVRAQLTPEQQAQLHSARSVNPEAYEDYLRGVHSFTTQYSTVEGLTTAKKSFEDSIRKDPSFPLAYVRLADSYVYLGFFRQLTPQSAYRSAKAALDKALELDNKIGEAHATQALLSWRHDWDWAATEREFKTALELAPNYAWGRTNYENYLAWTARIKQARAELAKSRELDPGLSFDGCESGDNFLLRDYEHLLESSRRGLVSDPNDWLGHYFLGVAHEGLGRRLDAIPEYQKAIEMSHGDQDPVAALAHAYAVTGKRSEAEKTLRDFDRKSKTAYVSPYLIATIYAGLGDKDKAFEFLEKAYEERSWDIPWQIKADVRIDNLRSDPRFRVLLRRMGLT